MNSNRRAFFKQGGLALAGTLAFPLAHAQSFSSIQTALAEKADLSPTDLAKDEAFWQHVQQAFHQSPQFTNLENGYFCCQAVEVMESQVDYIRMINKLPSYYMRNHQIRDRENVKRRLAAFAGCSQEELIITRNTTESLNTVVFGMDFKPGDEAILCDMDYGSMQEQFKQQSQRSGLKLKWVDLPLHPQSDEEIVARYQAAISPKTRVILVSHVINICGQVLPVQKIADMAHDHGVEIICDGAHAFGHLDFQIPDLHVDYFGTSLHKWMCCPLGAGLLYVRKDKIEGLWPLFGDVSREKDDIRKLEHIGTQPCSTHLAIGDALSFHQAIGSKQKEARLRYLRNYWVEQVKDLGHIIINSPYEAERSCAIGNVAVRGMTPHALAEHLYEQHKIYTVAINRKSVKGIRVTPHLYTTLADLDKLVGALHALG